MMMRHALFGIAILLSVAAPDAGAIPAWARKHNVACSNCHYPMPPRLNQAGLQFRWAGYRLPGEIGKSVEVAQISNYLAARGRVQYVYEQDAGEAPRESAFRLADASLFYGGPFGSRHAGFFEIEHSNDGFGLIVNVLGAWGSPRAYAGFRVGQMRWGPQAGLAGLDRPAGITTPGPISRPLTGGIPFAFPSSQLGAEVFFVARGNRVSVAMLNGVDSSGGSFGKDADTWKDVVVIDQLLFDDAGSGVILVSYTGTVRGIVPGLPGESHFTRLVASANKIVGNLEAMAGVVYGRDWDVPMAIPGGVLLGANTGLGYWFSGQFFPQRKVAVYGRYERMDPNTDLAGDAAARVVGGAAMPLGVPQYFKLAAEYWVDLPDGAGRPDTHRIALELMLAF
jgi:hypothetical protein